MKVIGTFTKTRYKTITSFPVLMHPFTSWIEPLPIILNKMSRVRGSRTCSLVARSLLSFIFACALGPFLFTPTPITYGASILARRGLYLESAASWSAVLSPLTPALGESFRFGRLIAGIGATDTPCFKDEVVPGALPVRTATCCRKRLYCLVKSAGRVRSSVVRN